MAQRDDRVSRRWADSVSKLIQWRVIASGLHSTTCTSDFFSRSVSSSSHLVPAMIPPSEPTKTLTSPMKSRLTASSLEMFLSHGGFDTHRAALTLPVICADMHRALRP